MVDLRGNITGTLAYQSNESNVRLGENTDAGSGTDKNVAIGSGATTSGSSTVSVGESASTTASNSVAIGSSSTAAEDGVAVGSLAEATAIGSVVIGRNVSVTTSGVGRIGTDQLVFGANDGGTIANADLNNGEITFEFDEANTNFVIRGKDSTGTVQTATVTY